VSNNPASAFNPKKNLAYARSITASQVNAVQPAGFAQGGGYVLVFNAGPAHVLFAAYTNANGAPTLAFPVDGAPPTGQPGTVIPAGAQEVIGIPANADSFAAIGSAAGPTLIYVQRGEGT
jgi:hypothetical protein